MGNVNFLLIFSVVCLCWTGPSHALTLRQKLIDAGTSVIQIKETMNATTTDLHKKLIQVNNTLNEKLTQITDVMRENMINLTSTTHQKLIQISDTMKGKAIGITEKLDKITDTLAEIIAATTCPDNFTRFESSCYYFGESLLSHGGDQGYARAQCEIKGSDLVDIETKQEADFINNQTVPGNFYYTSGHRHGSYLVWDTTGVNITDGYAPWAPGQPDGPAAHDCTYFKSYICETKILACI